MCSTTVPSMQSCHAAELTEAETEYKVSYAVAAGLTSVVCLVVF